jgi:hypothetical protein
LLGGGLGGGYDIAGALPPFVCFSLPYFIEHL